jgi:hypothetical protein
VLEFEGNGLRFERADDDREASATLRFVQDKGVGTSTAWARRQAQNFHVNSFQIVANKSRDALWFQVTEYALWIKTVSHWHGQGNIRRY